MKTKDVTFTASMIALAIVLEYISTILPFFKMPQGGHPTLAVIPIVILGYKKNICYAMLGGLIIGLIPFNAFYIVHPFQFLLDYVLAFLAIGLCSIFTNIYKPQTELKRNILLISGILLAMSLRFLCHFFSGIFYFRGDDGWGPAIIYSLSYNFWYMFVTTIITIVFSLIIINRLIKLNYLNKS